MRRTGKYTQLIQTPSSKRSVLPSLHSQKRKLRVQKQDHLHKSASKPVSLPSGIRLKQVCCGTISIVSRKAFRRFNKNFVMNEMPERYRNSLKLRTIKWLLSSYRVEIDKLLANCKAMLLQASSRGHLTVDQFRMIMISLGLEDDSHFIDRLFWVFDDNANGIIEAKEVIIGLEIFRKSSFNKKLELFFDICDIDGSGDIDEEEFFHVIKMCVPNEAQRKVLRKSLHELFVLMDKNKSGTITKDELVRAASQSDIVKSIIENTVGVTGDDNAHHRDLYQPTDVFSLTGPACGRTNGTYHRGFDKLFNAVSEFENKSCPYTYKNKELLKYWKETNGPSDGFSDEEDNLVFDTEGEEIIKSTAWH